MPWYCTESDFFSCRSVGWRGYLGEGKGTFVLEFILCVFVCLLNDTGRVWKENRRGAQRVIQVNPNSQAWISTPQSIGRCVSTSRRKWGQHATLFFFNQNPNPALQQQHATISMSPWTQLLKNSALLGCTLPTCRSEDTQQVLLKSSCLATPNET